MSTTLLDYPAPIVDDATRRQFLAGLAAAGLLAGCGTDPADPDTTPAGSGAFPVTIEHQFGATVIQAAPTRVVSVGYSDQDPLLAFGVVPVGLRDWFGDQPNAVWPWAQPLLGAATPEVLPAAALNFEATAALRPDLIVGRSMTDMTSDDYEKLSRIAPTVGPPMAGAPSDWRPTPAPSTGLAQRDQAPTNGWQAGQRARVVRFRPRTFVHRFRRGRPVEPGSVVRAGPG